ncbi:hypothetical protein PybrP1_012723, partial [[Pythium] brassicae (nom. inval.)]
TNPILFTARIGSHNEDQRAAAPAAPAAQAQAAKRAMSTAADDGGHLFLSARGGVEYAGDARLAWLDAAHSSVLVLSPRSRRLRQIALDTSLDTTASRDEAEHARVRKRSARSSDSGSDSDDRDLDGSQHRVTPRCGVETLYDFADPQSSSRQHSDGERAEQPVALARLSLDKQFLAVQTSDIEVQVVRLATRERHWIMCRPNAGNRILADGVVWSTHSSAPGSSQDIFLVTKMGIEHYRASVKRRSCALHRAIGVYIHTFWYAASHGVLVVSTGSRANEIVPYLLRGANVEKLPRLIFSAAVSRSDLYLAPLYGQLYAVYGDTRSAKLLLYLIERNKVSCVRSLNLMLPPGTALEYSVVDNLLACHSLDFNVSLFFDIKSDAGASEPFSHPLPISLRAPERGRANDVGGVRSRLSSSSSSSSSSLDDLSAHDLMSVFGEPENKHGAVSSPTCAYASSLAQHRIRRARSVESMNVRTPSAAAGYKKSADEDEEETKAVAATHDGPRLRRPQTLERAMTTMVLGKMDHHQFESDQHYFSRWRFVPPNLVQRSFTVKDQSDGMEQVQVRKLQVNLRGICRSCARHKGVLPFLLRRGDHVLAKTLALELVRNTMQEQELTLTGVATLLNAVQTFTRHDVDHGADESPNDTSSDDESSVRSFSSSSAYTSQQDLTPQLGHSSSFRGRILAEGGRTKSSGAVGGALVSRNAHGFLLVLQSEFYEHVWDPLLRGSTVASNGRLSVYLTEFVRNLHVNMVPVESCTYLALARAFLSADEPDKLYQFLQSNMLADSPELARLLVCSKSSSRALLQAGLDMHMRLGAIAPLVKALLGCGEVDRAVAISWRNMRLNSYDASVIPALHFYDAMVEAIWTSHEASTTSPFQVAQRLRKLLLFLKVWDPASLEPSGELASLVARESTARFPASLLDPGVSERLRAALGFR